MTWIYAYPAWLFMLSAVVFGCALAVGALAVTRTKLTRNELITHNDVAGPILSTIGTVLAVLMSFMVVGVWQEYDASARTVQEEASALADLHHLADLLPPPDRGALHSVVDRYITEVLFDEWPRMKHGGESLRAHDTAYSVQRVVAAFVPKMSRGVALQTEGLQLATRFLDARRERLHDNTQGIPLILWVTLLFTGAVTVVFSFYFRVEHAAAQYVMVIAMTAVIMIIFALTAELDYPFRGDFAVKPAPFVHTYDTVHGIISP